MLEELLDKKVNVIKELVDTHKCRFMGILNTYDITIKDKGNFKYPKAILNKEFGGASVLPVDKKGNVYLEIQYRFPLRETIIELPAGRSEIGETSLDCAKRELREETGCITDKIIEQATIYAQPEFTNERLGSFVALDCEQTEKQHLDADETVCVFKIPYEGAIELVKNNVIKDERTIIALGISRCIQGLRFSTFNENLSEFTQKVLKRMEYEKENLEEKEVGIDYTLPCEFGLVRDHIVIVPGNKNSRRECFYLKSGSIVLPISKSGKLGFQVRYMPAVDKNLVYLPEKLEFNEIDNLCEFGEMLTAVGYSNDRQNMFLSKGMEETEDFIWLTVDKTVEYRKCGKIEDGRVLAIVLKYLIELE